MCLCVGLAAAAAPKNGSRKQPSLINEFAESTRLTPYNIILFSLSLSCALGRRVVVHGALFLVLIYSTAQRHRRGRRRRRRISPPPFSASDRSRFDLTHKPQSNGTHPAIATISTHTTLPFCYFFFCSVIFTPLSIDHDFFFFILNITITINCFV